MNKIDSILPGRDFILCINFRFLPKTQPIKQTAVDKIIEQILFSSLRESGLSLQQIQDIFSSTTKVGYINPHDMRNSIYRLKRSKRIVSRSEDSIELYTLSQEAKDELAHIKDETERRYNLVINRLFKESPEKIYSYSEAFFKLLSLVFSQLGEEYVRVIRGDITSEDFLSASTIRSIVKEVSKEFNLSDINLFESAIINFFRYSDPEYDYIKWNLAQNYYIVKVLGLDPKGFILSKELFRHAIFYLDTNIIICALEPTHKHHNSFLILSRACKKLGIEMRVCQISLEELNNWLIYQRRLIEQVVDQIPDETAPKVDSIFYEIYYQKKKAGETFNFEDLFKSFDNPLESLKNLFEVKLEDDLWFDKARWDEHTIQFAEVLKSKYYEEIRMRLKYPEAALHDATLMLWIQKLREEYNNENYWLVTLDSTLPGSIPKKFNNKNPSLAITLDALLQWISPLAVGKDKQESLAITFAEMIRNRLLPQEKIFDLEDFLIFHDMGMSCKEIPAKDVEECIRYVKKNIGIHNYNKPEYREKLHYEISRFFASPDRKFKQEIARLEAKIEGIEQKYEEDLAKSLKYSAKDRLVITSLIFLIIEFIIGYLAIIYGEGLNWFQKLLNSWPFLGIVGPVISILIGCLIIGKKRLKALGWPFTKIFKA